MDKGWGLTLESSSDKVGFFKNKPFFGFNLSPRLNNIKGGEMFSGAEFPADEKRPGMVNEVDFFSEKKSIHDVVVKKENSQGNNTMRTDLFVHVSDPFFLFFFFYLIHFGLDFTYMYKKTSID